MTPPIVKRYLLALGRYKWVIPVTVTLGLAGAGVVARQPLPPPSYDAGGTLNYIRPPVSLSATGAQIQDEGQELTEDVLLSSKLLESVSKQTGAKPKDIRKTLKLSLPDPPGSGGRNQPQGPRLIQMYYTDSTADRAVKVVDALLKGMVEVSRDTNKTRLKAVIDSIEQRLPQIRQDLMVAEQNLEQYDRREGPALLAAQNGSLLAAITGSQNQIRQTQQGLESVNVQIASLEQKLGLTADEAYVASALSADPIIANLRTQLYANETQLTTLGRDLRAEHPTMINLRRQQDAYEQLLQERAQEVISGGGLAAPLPTVAQVRQGSSLDPTRQQLANTLVGLQTQRQTLQQQLASTIRIEQQLRQEYSSIPNKQLERARLEQQITLKKALFDKVQDKLVDARAAEAETVSSLNITKPADITKENKPSKNVPIILVGGIVAGLVLGGALVFLLDILEGVFYTPEDIQNLLKQQDVLTLGVLPLGEGKDPNGAVAVLLEADSPHLEFYDRFRGNLKRLEGAVVRVVLVTSTSQGEGKAASAYNLAIASARVGKRTLLVEADLRSPSHVKALRVAPDPDSFIEPLRFYSQPSECVRLVPDVGNLYVIPSPGPQKQVTGILESSEMRRLLEEVRGRFDLVVVEAPPLSVCNDALLLEPFTDGIILSTQPGRTKSSLLTAAIEQFNESETLRLLGAVIAGVEMSLPEELEEYDYEDDFVDEEDELEDEDIYEEVVPGKRI